MFWFKFMKESEEAHNSAKSSPCAKRKIEEREAKWISEKKEERKQTGAARCKKKKKKCKDGIILIKSTSGFDTVDVPLIFLYPVQPSFP